MHREKDALMSERCQQTSPDTKHPLSHFSYLYLTLVHVLAYTSNETCLLKTNCSEGHFIPVLQGMGLLEMWQLCFSRLQRPSSANLFCKRAVRFSYARCMDMYCVKLDFLEGVHKGDLLVPASL